MAKYYASSPEIGLVPLEGDGLLEAIEDATGRSWKVSERKTIPILDIDARPVAWIDPEDRTWTLTPPPQWFAGGCTVEAESVPLEH